MDRIGSDRQKLTLNSCENKLTQVIKLENMNWWELRVFALDLPL